MEKMRTFMDEVRCSGSELRLADCAFRGWAVEDCGHWQDIAIRCKGIDVRQAVYHMEFVSISFGCFSTTVSVASFFLAVLALLRVLRVERTISPSRPEDAPPTIAMHAPAEAAVHTAKDRPDESEYANLL